MKNIILILHNYSTKYSNTFTNFYVPSTVFFIIIAGAIIIESGPLLMPKTVLWLPSTSYKEVLS